jgi:hypothetical protein
MKIKGVAQESCSGTTKEDEGNLIPKAHSRMRWMSSWIYQQMLMAMVNLGKVENELSQSASQIKMPPFI